MSIKVRPEESKWDEFSPRQHRNNVALDGLGKWNPKDIYHLFQRIHFVPAYAVVGTSEIIFVDKTF